MIWNKAELEWINNHEELINQGFSPEICRKILGSDLGNTEKDRLAFGITYLTKPDELKLVVVGSGEGAVKLYVNAFGEFDSYISLEMVKDNLADSDEDFTEESIYQKAAELYAEELEVDYGREISNLYLKLLEKGTIRYLG